MVEESQLKYWLDAGHVARRTLEAMKLELQPGKTFHEIIESAERFIHRHGGKPAFGTIAVNDLAAHFTTNHMVEGVEGWEGDMVLQKGDLVKIDFGVHIKGHIGDNALTIEIDAAKNEHTEQIVLAQKKQGTLARRRDVASRYTVVQSWSQLLNLPSMRAFNQFATCGHQLKPWELHAGVSVPSYACGKDNMGFRGVVEEGGVYAIEPFNTTGASGLIENIGRPNSSNIYCGYWIDDVSKSPSKKSAGNLWVPRWQGT